jgi:hypothetical protein
MRYTLLELTQRILEALESDEVDSIADTEEAYTVANIIKECYFEIVGRVDLPEKEDIYQLEASGDSLKPTFMSLPEFAIDLKKLKYNDVETSDPSWYDIKYLKLDDFINMNSSIDLDGDNTGSMEILNSQSQTFTFKFYNDRLPTYYTSFNDRDLIFDSYDVSVNATLVGAKTMCWGTIVPTFTMSDNYTPDIDPRQFQLLLQAAKAQAYVEIKQIENPKAEKKERRNEILAQRNKNAIDRRTGSQKYRRFGRK